MNAADIISNVNSCKIHGCKFEHFLPKIKSHLVIENGMSEIETMMKKWFADVKEMETWERKKDN